MDANALKDTFVVVQDMFLTETAALADVVLPAANLYEKSGSVTNSYGDLQQVKKAGDRAGVRTDFEMIVRIADKMGADVRKLVPFGSGVRADMGQTRGAQSGEADRHAVWLTANNLEPRLSPFDPDAILDEIQRLVPGYDLRRLQLLSGNDQHLSPAAMPIKDDAGLVQISSRRDLVLPANDTLFTSGTLGRYSAMLTDLQQNEAGRHLIQIDQTSSRLEPERDLEPSNQLRSLPALERAQGRGGAGDYADGRGLHCAAGAQGDGPHAEPLGPGRVGPFGLLQPLVDGAKLFLKEDLMPLAVERPLFILAPVIALGCALISVAVVPFGAVTPAVKEPGVDLFEVANVNIGLLVILGSPRSACMALRCPAGRRTTSTRCSARCVRRRR